MARFRSSKRAKELQRKAKHEAKEARKRERREKGSTEGADDDIDWSQAVGMDPPATAGGDDAVDETSDGAESDEDESDDAESDDAD